MTLTQYDEVEQRSEEWFARRRGIVTASTVFQLVTPKTKKPASNDISRALTNQLAAERITGVTDPTFQTDDMLRGVLDEPLAIQKYAEHHNPVTRTGFMVRREDDWTLGYSPDGLVGDDGLVEVKCPRAKNHLATIIANEVPSQHAPQLQAGLLVTGRKWIDFISYCGGMPLFVKRVEPDPEWQDAITAACQSFEENVQHILTLYAYAETTLPPTERLEIAV